MTQILDAFIGPAPTVYRCMFPQADAHVLAWRRWRWLQDNLSAADWHAIAERRAQR